MKPSTASPFDSLDPDEAAREEAYSAIDELIRSALAYHTPERFVELMKFTRRLPKYSPFNCMLLHIQNPDLKYVASPQQWAGMGRKIKPGGRPLVILAPMHPVMFVFDVSDTVGAPLPPDIEREIEDPFAVEGFIEAKTWKKVLRCCNQMGIQVKEEPLDITLAGDVRPIGIESPKYLLRLNAAHDSAPRFATLAHELAHLFCGHLGKTVSDFWEKRDNLTLASRELEAEAVAYLVASRFKLNTASKKYLSLYLTPGVTLPPYSMEIILTAAGAVELMAKGKLPGKERSRRRKEADGKPRAMPRLPRGT